jgi:deoxyadenosine/deoxycytidine kinase
LLYRFKQYEEASKNKVTCVLDRGIWEDWFFAKLLMKKNNPKTYKYFKIFWKNLIKEKIKLFGKPNLYIYLKVDWKTFKKRIFIRGRKEEIDNFDKNKDYFKNLLDEYEKNFVSLLKKWNIKTLVLNTNKLNKDEVLEKTLEELKKIGI